jgi:hypothetical protein
MKNLFKVALLATGLFTATQGHAQTVKNDAKAVGHKTSEVAAKGDAAAKRSISTNTPIIFM